MLIVVNVILVVAACLLILVIAAMSSIPSRRASGLDSPDGDMIGPASLPNDVTTPQPGAGRVTRHPHIAAAGMQ